MRASATHHAVGYVVLSVLAMLLVLRWDLVLCYHVTYPLMLYVIVGASTAGGVMYHVLSLHLFLLLYSL